MNTNNKSNIQEDSDKKLNIVKKVLGIIFCVIILALSCFIYANGEESKKSQSSMYEQEKQQVAEMTEYLNGIDESVSTNMEHLAQAAVVQADTEKTLKEVTNTLSGMEEQITEVEKVLTDTVVESMDSSTALMKESLSDTKTEISKQIETVNKEISTILSDMNDENNDNFQQTYTKIETLQSQLEAVENSMNNYYKDLTELIKKFQKQNTKEHEEILDALLKAQDRLNKYLQNAFDSLNLRMDEDMENLMEELNVLHNQIIATQNDLTDILNIMEENDSKRQQEVKDMFSDTKNYLTYIEETFADAHAKLQDIIIKFKELEEANHTETLNVLQVMEKDMQETTENGFQNLTETMNSFETSLNSTLDTMQESIFSSFSSTNSKIESSFQSMNENIDNKFQNTNENIENKFSETNGKLENNFQTANETLNQNFQDVKDSMAQNFMDLNTNITTKNEEMVQNINNNFDEKVANLSTTINNYNESNGDNLEELKRYLNEQLAQVFTSVSNGKSSLASALLTIGTGGVEKDATFLDIADAIEHSQDCNGSGAVSRNLSEGVTAWVEGEYITGTGEDNENWYQKGYADGRASIANGQISYEYHVHKKGDGTESSSVIYSTSNPGGCYRAAGHTHHATGQCSGQYHPATQPSMSCSVCGFSWGIGDVYSACPNHPGCTVYNPGSPEYYSWTCGNYINTWTIGCGKNTSTVEKATIIFN